MYVQSIMGPPLKGLSLITNHLALGPVHEGAVIGAVYVYARSRSLLVTRTRNVIWGRVY